MPKGLFTQSAYVLLERPVELKQLETALAGRAVVRTRDEDAEANRDGWMGGFAGALVAFRPEVNGRVSIDLIDRRYPDAMGNTTTEMDLFGAWSTGWFGPFVFPGNLARAAAMARPPKEADSIARRHGALVRVLSSYVFGAGGRRDENRAVLPEGYAALAELEAVTDLARALLELPGALAYFNPNGETLLTKAVFDGTRAFCRQSRVAPLPLWSNVRLFDLAERAPGWTLLDTVGMEQLDVEDMEACFETGAFEPAEVDHFLRNAVDYVRQKGPVIRDGDTMDGPGGARWQGLQSDEAIAPRPRSVIRWLPLAGKRAPDVLVPRRK